MIDSVLKGTGNSRFLKSAVPAGTSWADALAMLQAGTFPIDFNGINTEGFQQVGTPLNKANLLKDATAAQIGLPPSTTPDGMFQALGNTGELHVWRKTVVTTEPIPEQPAGYNLGSKTNFLIGTPSRSSREPYINVMYANTVSVSNDGTVNISGDSSAISGWYPSNGDSPNYLQMRGKFIKITQFLYLDAPRTVDMDTVYYIPNDATATLPNYGSANGEFRIEMQKVTGYPYTPAIPAGTTTTYPVSTNPNAYQEGDDAKPAGYTLGEVVTGRFMLEGYFNSSHPTYYIADTKPTVTDDGIVSVNDVYGFGGYNGDKQQLQTLIRGKYIKCRVDDYTSSDFRNLGVVYIPEDTVVLQNSSVDGTYIDRYQPVTGYAAIPANTTIEYLGCLGDKARVQVVSYVGTGTYGSSNPNSLTFDFVPKIVVIQSPNENTNLASCIALNGSKSVVTHPGRGYASEFSWNKKTVSWYNPDGYQLNNSGWKYTAAAIG
jgi:hypothetical protein